MEPLLDKLVRSKKARSFVISGVCSFVIALLWFFTFGYICLMEDDGRYLPHPRLDMAIDIMVFPVSYLPGWGSWDGRSHWMSFETWQWYEMIGVILNSLLWGFFLVWFCRFVVRLIAAKRKAD